MLLSPEMPGLATKIAQSMGFWANLGKNPSFNKVVTEIGSLGFTEFGIDSERTDVSK